MTLEEKLAGWTGPSSDSEQEKQDRAERMVKQAVENHEPFKGYSFRVFTKGSYKNNTNVRSDSDVDIAVQCQELCYWEEQTSGAHPSGSGSYQGIWTPSKLRSELTSALKAKFPGEVDASGSTALRVNAGSARVDADVVPSFDYRYYYSPTSWHDGSKVFKKDGSDIVNYPDEQYKKGVAKNNRTSRSYKSAVRIMKRVENAMVEAGYHRVVPSYFIECLVYNCPDQVLLRSTWVSTIKGVISHIFHELEGNEPVESGGDRWLEVSEWRYLFHSGQSWTRQDGRDFAKAAWNYLELSN